MSTYLGTDGKEHRFLSLQEIRQRYLDKDETLATDLEEFFSTWQTDEVVMDTPTVLKRTVRLMDKYIKESRVVDWQKPYAELYKLIKRLLKKRIKEIESNKQ